MAFDDRQANRLLAQQRGVLTRSQALDIGLTLPELRYRIRPGGPWQRMLPGIYLTAADQPTPEQRDMAALLYAGPRGAITGLAALRGWQLNGSERNQVDVLVPARRQRASRGFVVIHRTRNMPRLFAVEGALRYALPARAVIDAVRGMTQLSDVRAIMAGAVQQRLCSVQLLADEVPAGPTRGTALARLVLAEVAAGIRSAPEGDLRDLIIAARLPMPLFNHKLYLNGGFLAKPDAYWPDHGVIVEIDSWEHHSPRDAFEETWARSDDLESIGLRMLHFTPRQLKAEGQHVTGRIAAKLSTGMPALGVVASPAPD